jgi:hypothetical protein
MGIDINQVNAGAYGTALSTTLVPKWRKALANTLLGAAPNKILIIGASDVVGRGSAGATGNSGYDGAKPGSFPVRIAKELARLGIPATWDSFFGSCGLDTGFVNYDTRIVLGVGWAPIALTTSQSLGAEYFRNTTTTNPLTFTPEGAWNTADVYYIQASGYDTVQPAIGGVNKATFSMANATTALAKATVSSGSTAAVQALTLARTGLGTEFRLIGVDCYDSAVPKARVLVSAKGGTVVNYWATGSQSYNVSKTAVWDLLAPDLTIILLTPNDWNANSGLGTDLTSYLTDMQTLITLAKRTGDVLLMVGSPSATPGYGYATDAIQSSYNTALKSLAYSQSCLFYSHYEKLGSYTAMNPLGYYFDALHLSGAGQNDAARQIVNIIAG